jgi:hypothetical protein
MNRRIPFTPNELRIIDTLPGFLGGPGRPLRDTPVTPRENIAALYYDKHPYWLPLPGEATYFMSPLYNDRLGRGGPAGVTDAFGITWEWVESAGGSIVRPGEPFMQNANEWKDKVIFPDLDAWDWAGEVEKAKCDVRLSTQLSLINGFWFERLVSFMDFAPAAMALIDDDQKDAVKALFAEMTDFACRLVDKYCQYWPALDGFNIHDDWSAQRSPFFSMETAYELFVPFMRELTDHIHSKGRYTTLHSCGHGEARVQCFIDGGFDGWDPQVMNDTHRLWETVGDRICISVVPEPFDPAATDEEEQRRRGRDFAERFCAPGKPAQLGFYGGPMLTPAFTEEVYIQSRKIFNR